MTSLHLVVPLLAAISSLLMAAVSVGPPHSRLRTMFGLGMVGFGLEAIALALLATASGPTSEDSWLRVINAVSLLVPIPWLLFVVALGTGATGSGLPPAWRLAVGSGIAATAIAVVLTAIWPPYIVHAAGSETVARLTTSGPCSVVVQILAMVALLGGLEACLRASSLDTRWRVKYLLLGLGSICAIRFYFLSHALLFNELTRTHLLSQAAALLLGNTIVAVALVRDRLLGSDLRISPQAVYRSVIVAAAGAYLLTVGLLGWALSWLGIPETVFWGSVLAFASALALAAALLSDDVRWRFKRLLGRHFYRAKYDYRHQWMSFTRRLGSLLTVEELAPQVLGAIAEATGARQAALYLRDDRDGRYHLVHAVGPCRLAPALTETSSLVQVVSGAREPLLVKRRAGRRWDGLQGLEELPSFGDGSAAVPLRWQGRLLGLMLVGPERTGAPYSAEDLEFLATVAGQAAGTIVTTRLSEKLARSREFEAFHRLTSFVIHDLKNAVAALSMLTQNALANFDDPEFQRDAIRTLSRTAGRIKTLLGRLSGAPEVRASQFLPLDLGALAVDTAAPLLTRSQVSLVRDLQPVPRVLGDPDALQRVIENLVTNAVEAMDGEGRLTVQTALRGGFVACSIADTGCGISEDFIKHSLFVPFRTTKKGGWGIGLYAASEVVAAHGGRIEVQSQEGAGTTVTVLLPAALGAESGGGSA